MGILRDGVAAGQLDPPDEELPEPLRGEVAEITELIGMAVPPALAARGMAGWTQLFGLISFELFGRINRALPHRDEYFDHQIGLMADLIGLP